MKLRRAMMTAAATAALAPLALVSAPAAFADESPSSSVSSPAATETSPAADPSTSPAADQSSSAAPSSDSPSASGSASASTSASASASASESASASASASSSPSESAEPSDEPSTPSGICEEDDATYKSKIHASLGGLPGEIAVGSGWHPFTLSVKNPTSSNLKDVIFYAGVGPSDPNAQYAFKTSQVQLQVKYDGAWYDVEDGAGHSNGYLDLADIKAGQTVDYQLRLNVKANAPVGEGLTIGGGMYFDDEENCIGADQASYLIKIVKAGTDTGGTKPQEGGQVPVPAQKPSKTNTQDVTGSLAETGSSSMLPTIGLVGGVAVVVGAGAVFAVRRRKGAGSGTAA
ncbi:LAETG motif-containing sortase-dependent surface protein [Streptomyces sp. NPDC059680]|uniref:LAETG motif-containing sortase-dependent surface protein n=1 Tax=Streptomyces sp. NPDC059680 TaxID=3346904 RepID=UPI0036899717